LWAVTLADAKKTTSPVPFFFNSTTLLSYHSRFIPFIPVVLRYLRCHHLEKLADPHCHINTAPSSSPPKENRACGTHC
jgi:hypothetical protein